MLNKNEKCIVKDEKDGNRPCNKPVHFVPATPPEVPYTGWRHVDETITDHLAVPESWI